jgi:hypothetical protein
MPRYYLHVRWGREFELDRDGVDFPDVETLKRETVVAAANVWRDFPNLGLDPAHFAVEVTDEFGTPVLSIPFVEALTADPPQGQMSYL